MQSIWRFRVYSPDMVYEIPRQVRLDGWWLLLPVAGGGK